MDVDGELDRLFGAPLGEFTATRDEIVATLKDANPSEARDVKKIKKPVVSAWAVNQLARREHDLLQELLGAGAAIETAQDPTELRDATVKRKGAITELLKAARRLLEEAGHNASSGTLDRISNTLLAATTGDARDALLQGRLTQDISPSGLEAWGLNVLPDTADSGDEAAHERAEQLARAADEAERAARDAARARDDARAALERAERDAEKASHRAREARDSADRALEEL